MVCWDTSGGIQAIGCGQGWGYGGSLWKRYPGRVMVPESHLQGSMPNQEVPRIQSKEAETEMSPWSWTGTRDFRVALGGLPWVMEPWWTRLRQKVGGAGAGNGWADHLPRPSAISFPLKNYALSWGPVEGLQTLGHFLVALETGICPHPAPLPRQFQGQASGF